MSDDKSNQAPVFICDKDFYCRQCTNQSKRMGALFKLANRGVGDPNNSTGGMSLYPYKNKKTIACIQRFPKVN